MEDWREFVAAIANRYKAKISYEILNEPDIERMPATYYCEYLKAAYEEIKKAAPDALVFGVNSTNDIGMSLESYLGKCMAAGAGKYMDVFAMHPYASSDRSVPSQMDNIRKIRENFRSRGFASISIWNGENFYLNPDWSVRNGSWYYNNMEPSSVARNYLVDMGEGLAGSTPCYISSFMSTKNRPYQYIAWANNFGNTPNACFAAHAACAQFLSGAEALRTVELPKRVLSYVFKSDEKLYSAIWAIKGEAKAEIIAPDGIKSATFDLFANPTGKNLEKASLLLGKEPVYIEWEPKNGAITTSDVERVCKAMEGTTVSSGEELEATGARILGKEKEAKLLIGIRNGSEKIFSDARVALSVEAIEFPVVVTLPDLKPREYGLLEIPLKIKGSPEKLDMEMTFNGNYSLLSAPFARELVASNREGGWMAIEKAVIGRPVSSQDLSCNLKECKRVSSNCIRANSNRENGKDVCP